MTPTPFKHAMLAALYIVLVAGVLTSFEGVVGPRETVLMPIAFISLLVLSVAVMGYLFFAEPLRRVLENNTAQGISFLGKTLAAFAVYVLIAISLMLLSSHL